MLDRVSLTWCSAFQLPSPKDTFRSSNQRDPVFVIQLYFFPVGFFLLAINHSCMPLKEKLRMLLPCHDFCPFSNCVTSFIVPLKDSFNCQKSAF
ncbi:hypothetical protein PFLUV_G00139220 [Perca fluviatilis]|uniref:Uncharacterized protein n=1 Tax=Perca fluviatilis TaxID=8168 RepID=A0A6A5F8I6_PERFL|nr:hypothetical protein PFLUV_G00139220 [Perca fluviatilis]